MIKQLVLKNFRQHQDLTLNFDAGVTVLRGQNEAGKTTIFEAIAYALFGTRSARNNDLSTHGLPENSQQVTLTFDVGGTTYVVKRTARAAEINYDGGRVTGQTDTARFCEQLFGVKTGTATKLMFVPQNEMRGILADGGSKTVTLIEQLANLSQLDDVITHLQEHYHTGKTDSLQAALASQQLNVAQAQTRLDENKVYEQQQLEKQQQLERQAPELAKQQADCETQLQVLRFSINEMQAEAKKKRELEDQLLRCQTRIQSCDRILNQPDIEFTYEDLDEAEADYERASQQSASLLDYAKLKDWQPTQRLQGSEAELEKQFMTSVKQHIELLSEVERLHKETKHLNSQLSDDTHCPTCHREWADLAERQAYQEHLRQQLEQMQQQLQTTEEQAAQAKQRRTHLHTILEIQVPEVPKDSRWQVLDDGYFPPLFQWQGEIPDETVIAERVRTSRQKYHDLSERQKKFEQQNTQKFQASNEKDELLVQQASLEQQLNPFTNLEERLQDKQNEVQNVQQTLSDITHTLNDNQRQLLSVKHMLQVTQRSTQAMTAQLESSQESMVRLQAEIQEAQQASALLKCLRTMKPQIASKVWQQVCNVVSHYFSIMRGQDSHISHSQNGFLADGYDTSSLSGSTLDVLGLAVRIALTKTFLPVCDCLLLDEPFAAADSERTANSLGVLTTLGFTQVLVITHEDDTEAIADQLITL